MALKKQNKKAPQNINKQIKQETKNYYEMK